MRGGCFNRSNPARANAFQLTLGPVDASGADARGEGGIIGDEQDQATHPAGAGEGESGAKTARAAEMAPDHAEAARQPLYDRQRVGRADRIGDEEGAGKGATISRARRFRETRSREELAADGGLG